MNFRTVLPYLELLIRNSLMLRIDGAVPMYKTTSKGSKALRYFREIEVLIQELKAFADEAI